MTLGGMIKHLAFVEDYWFSHVLLGNPPVSPFAEADWESDEDWDWHSADQDTGQELFTLWHKTIEASDRILDETVQGTADLRTIRAHAETWHGESPATLRWILVHMIEEYARHNGHADLIRESIDGLTGD